MELVIHGVNIKKNFFLLSNYSLTTQIVIINFSTACLAFFFLIFFNLLLLLSSKNLEEQEIIINEKTNQITKYLGQNAIKRIFTFDDTCNRVSKESNLDCISNNFLDKNYEDKLPQLDPTYTQEYIYSNFLNTSFNVKIFAENAIKFADTNDFIVKKEDVLILEINESKDNKLKKNINFYQSYKKFYFNLFNFLKEFFDIKKLNKLNLTKLKNENILVIEIIDNKSSNSYIYKDHLNNFRLNHAKPILKDNKVYGVVFIDNQLNFDDYDSASSSFLLTNFFIFFISIMFFLSFFFSKSIVSPIKILSRNTNLERDKVLNNRKIITYPNRKDEIGKLSEDIQSMSSDLKKRIKQIEEFVFDVSHELKNPLTGLKSSSDLLKTDKLENKNKELLVNNISTDVDRMNILISDISNYSLTQFEISEEALEEVELVSLLNNFKETIKNKTYSLEIINENKALYLHINKNKFIQVIHNLLDNALAFIPKNSKILIFIKATEKNCIINFVDQGPGINMSYKDKIFERFYTDRLKNKKEHSGLGLSISKKIIEDLDGSIYLIKSSHLGFEGACFEIKLPLKD